MRLCSKTAYYTKTITKSIQEGEDVDQVFDFEMRLDDHGVNGPRGDLMFNGGVAEFQMSPGDELIVSDLLAGMHYEIVETDSGGYIPVMENAEVFPAISRSCRQRVARVYGGMCCLVSCLWQLVSFYIVVAGVVELATTV